MDEISRHIKPRAMTSTVAMTLPILCQICLGKVREPVSCNNNHVYCKACIIIWTSKNKHCPTCRVEITTEQPFRLLLGGQNVETSESPAFAEPMNRKARVKSLFNSYEDEIQRLNDIIIQLEEEIRSLKDVASATVSPTPSISGSSLCETDRQSLEMLKSKLAEASQLQHKVNLELRGYQQENNDLKQANIDLSRDNDQLRYDLSQRTPSKIGRFTVAALESQIEKQKKEISNLKKALSVSDNHIQALETRLKLANQSKLQSSLTNDIAATCNVPNSLPGHDPFLTQSDQVSRPTMTSSTQNKADVGLHKDHSSFKSAHSASPTGARKSLLASLSSTTEHSEGFSPSPFLKFDIGDKCGSLHPSESVTKWNSSPVTQLLASAPSNTLPKVMTTPTKRSRSTELMTHSLDSLGFACLASGAVLESPTKRSKPSEKPHSIEFSTDLSCTNVTACSKPEAASRAARSADLRQEVAAFDLSINTDFADCLNILETAEKAVQSRLSDSEMVKPS